MAIPLKDFRLGITELIDAALEAEALAFGLDKTAVARDVLDAWAKRRHRAHTIYARRAMANGVMPDSDGVQPADDGTPRRPRR